jgi:WD40 repeat protein
MEAMRYHRDTSYNKPENSERSEYSEFEEEIRPPVQKRVIQIVIATLAVTTIVSVIVAKVMSDQNREATQKADKAAGALSTAEVQVTALAAQVSSLTAALEASGYSSVAAPGVISSTRQGQQFVRDDAAQTRSQQLAYVALGQLTDDPERSILIALEANKAAHTSEAEDVLRRALQASHFRLLLSQPGAKIRTAEFSPNGELIVTTNSIGEARVWNANDGALGLLLRGTGNILSAQFSPDGRYILTLSSNQTAILWNADTGSTVAVFSGQGSNLTSAEFSSYANRFATGSAEGTVHVWYTNGISDSIVMSSSLGSIQHVEWSPDDRLILASGDRGLAVWDTQSGKQLYNLTSNPFEAPIWDAHFIPYRMQLVMTSGGSIRILDDYSDQIVREISGGIDSSDMGSMQVSPDGSYLLAGKALWELDTGQVIARYPAEYGLVAQFSPTGRYLLTYNDPYALTVWDMRSSQWPPTLAATIRVNSYPRIARFSPYGQTLVTVDLDGAARVWAVQLDNNLPADYESLNMLALSRVTRALTCQERQTYLNDTAPCTTP